MKSIFKRMGAGLMALFMVVSLLVGVIPADTFAATITYSSYSNSGTRNETCLSLEGTGASDYYTSAYTFDTLSAQNSSQLLQSLRTLMTSTHTKTSSYNNCRDYANRTDCEKENGRVVLLYTSYSATMSQYNGWNREHVWPQSLGGGNTSGGGADLHHVRPSDAGVNSSRGNKKYGESNNGTEKYGSNPATGYLGGTYNSTYFEPLDNVKGDVARICLYVYVRWGSAWGADSITEVFQSVDILLEWMALDPVDTWEMGRNEVVENIQGNRNVFIDYPEYAWLLFGRDVPEGITTPSDNDGVTANPGGNSGSSSGNSGSSGNTGSGNSGSSSGSTGTTSMITSPKTGKAYKLSMNNGKDLYFMGVINKDSTPWYMKSSENVADAIDVYLEAASGGYRLYFTINGAKTYLVMYKDGTHYSLKLTTEPSTVYTWNSQYNTLVAMNEDKECFIGTSGTYNTFSCNTMDKVGSSYVAHLFGVGGSSSSNSGGSNSGSSNTGSSNTGSSNTGNSGSTTTTNPPATQPPVSSGPAPSEGTQESTPTTLPAGPAPMATKPLNPDDFYTAPEEDNTTTIVIIVSIVVGILALGIVAFFIVMNAKKRANAAPVEIAETPSEENAEQPETETDTPAENE